MAERMTFGDAEYILYSDMLDRLQQRFPHVSPQRLVQIVTTEIDAMTGGVPRIIPAEVEMGAGEMLERIPEHGDQSSEVA